MPLTDNQRAALRASDKVRQARFDRELPSKLASHLRGYSPFKYGLIADAIERGESRPVPSEIALSFARKAYNQGM